MEWYEELDYDENPFVDNENTELIGYDDILDEMQYRISSGGLLFMEGKPGQGKTAVLKRAIGRFKGKGKIIYLNCKKIEDLNIEDVLLKKRGLFGKIFKKMPKGMVLLVDEIESLSPKNCERLKYFYDQNYVKSIVFTGSNFKKVNFTESFVDRISKVVKLKEISEDEAIDIIQTRLANNEFFKDENIIKDVFKMSKKNPKIFLQNCEQLCKYTIDRNGKAITKDTVNTVLGSTKNTKKEKTESTVIDQDLQMEKHEESIENKPEKSMDKPAEVENKEEDIAERYY